MQAKDIDLPIDALPELLEDFRSKIIHSRNGCWEWMGNKWLGYGRLFFKRKAIRAHRFSFKYIGGRNLSPPLILDHTCNNRICVNPNHLVQTTITNNVMRGIGPTALNARQTHCKNGHPLFGDNLYLKPPGYRVCRICRRITSRLRDIRIRAAMQKKGKDNK